MTSAFRLNRARASDRKQLIQFWDRLDLSLPPNSFGSSPAGKKRFYHQLARQITKMDHGFALIAYLNADAVGCISGHLYDKPESINSPVGIVYNLWVEPEVRRQGLASLLAQEAESRLRELGARSFQVAWREDPTAENFWRKRGYQAYETMAGKHA